MEPSSSYAVFAQGRLVARGALSEVLRALKAYDERGTGITPLVFDDTTGQELDFDLRGSVEEVLERELPRPAPAGRGRPRLGVVSREVSLLPRHWQWLDEQPNGNSAALRRIIDEAIKRTPDAHRARRARAAANRAATALAGDLRNFEEAMRALYRKDEAGFTKLTRGWPRDVRTYLSDLLSGTWASGPQA